MNRTLLVIDSYISNLERASYCEKLINQIKGVFQDYKILLINKSKKNFGLESLVDYYFNMGDSFMVGLPPQEFIDNGWYAVPYVYVDTNMGTLENWMSYTGYTDHVAGIYNSFVLSAQFAKTLGFQKIFKFEFDTEFDLNELKNLKNEIDNFEDYILYGVRHQGQWTQNNLVDVHIIGYTPKIFDGFEIVRNDDEFWDLCRKVKYYCKWIEYIIPALIDVQKETQNLNGTVKHGHLEEYYPKTKFDVVNSPSMWTEKWKTIPMVGKISLDRGKTELEDIVCIFYYNNDFEDINIKTVIYEDDNIIHSFDRNLKFKHWVYNEITVNNQIRVISEYTSPDGQKYSYDKIINKEDIKKLNYRMLKL